MYSNCNVFFGNVSSFLRFFVCLFACLLLLSQLCRFEAGLRCPLRDLVFVAIASCSSSSTSSGKVIMAPPASTERLLDGIPAKSPEECAAASSDDSGASTYKLISDVDGHHDDDVEKQITSASSGGVRWLLLAALSLTSLSASTIYYGASTSPSVTAMYYNVSLRAVNTLSVVGQAGPILGYWPAMFVADTRSMSTCFAVGALLCVTGAWLRWFSKNRSQFCLSDSSLCRYLDASFNLSLRLLLTCTLARICACLRPPSLRSPVFSVSESGR